MRLRQAGPADVPAILHIMTAAYDALADKSLYITDDEDYIAAHIAAPSFILLAEEEGRPVGFFLTCVPGLADNNLGHYLGFSEEQLLQVAMMDSAAVLPEYQGKGVMGQMFRAAAERAGEDYPYLLGTVSPENGASLHNFKKCGFTLKQRVMKPNGYERLLMGKFRETR